MVRLFCCIVAVVVPQFTHLSKDPLAFCTLIPKWSPCFVLQLCSLEVLLFLFVLVPVFDEAAAVLEGKATFFAGWGQELVLMRMKVPVKVEHLALAKLLATLLTLPAALSLFSCRICLFVVICPVLRGVDFTPQGLNWRLLR